MSYEKVVKILDENSEQLLEQMALEVLAQNLMPFKDLETIKTIFRPGHRTIIHYLKTGDLSQWQTYIQQRVKANDQENIADRNMQAAADIAFNLTAQLVADNLPGEENQKNLEMFERRLHGLYTVASATAATTTIKKRWPTSSQ